MDIKSLAILIFVPLLGLLLYSWLCKVFNIENVFPDFLRDLFGLNTVPAIPPPYVVDMEDAANYENIAAVLVSAVAPLAFACKFVEPKCAADLQAAEAKFRVGRENGQPVYRYELKRIPQYPLMEGGGKLVPIEVVPAKEIARKITSNLQSEQKLGRTLGYSFDGPIYGIELAQDRIRIEIWGVSRKLPYPMGGINL